MSYSENNIKGLSRNSYYVRNSRSKMFLKIGVLKPFAIFFGKNLCRSLFLIKFQAWSPATQVFSCELREIFENTIFYRKPSVAALYLAIIHSWQLSNSRWSSTIKIHPYISGNLQIFFTLMFFHFLWKMPVCLIGDAKRVVWSKRPAMLLVRRGVSIIMHLISLIKLLKI